MANGKAAGLDELLVEHIKYCHPIIMCILYKLFNFVINTGHIPEDFEASYTVRIPKCDGCIESYIANRSTLDLSKAMYRFNHPPSIYSRSKTPLVSNVT